MRLLYDFRAEALPPLRPAAFFCAVVPPWLELPPEPDFFPPRLDAPGELAILAARSFDMPLSFRASYCFSFLTLALLDGIRIVLLPPSQERSLSGLRVPRRAGSANHAVMGRRLTTSTTAPVPSRTDPSRSTTRRGAPADASSTRKRASQSSRRTTPPSRRCVGDARS